MAKRQTAKPGTVFKVPLPNDKIAYGKLLDKFKAVIFDCYISASEIKSLEEILTLKKLCYISISSSAFRDNEFEIIGKVSVSDEELSQTPPVYTQNVGNLQDCEIFYQNGERKIVKPEECLGLETFSLYSAIHVIKRLDNFYNGRPNFNLLNAEKNLRDAMNGEVYPEHIRMMIAKNNQKKTD